jgi:hypothetical protein
MSQTHRQHVQVDHAGVIQDALEPASEEKIQCQDRGEDLAAARHSHRALFILLTSPYTAHSRVALWERTL